MNWILQFPIVPFCSLSSVHMSKLHPVPKKVKPKSLNYLANKVPVDLRGWVAVAEIPHLFAWPNGPTTKNEQCSPAARMQFFGSKSKKGRRGFSLQGGDIFWQSRSFFAKVRHFSCNKGKKLQWKGPYLRMCTNPYTVPDYDQTFILRIAYLYTERVSSIGVV